MRDWLLQKSNIDRYKRHDSSLLQEGLAETQNQDSNTLASKSSENLLLSKDIDNVENSLSFQDDLDVDLKEKKIHEIEDVNVDFDLVNKFEEKVFYNESIALDIEIAQEFEVPGGGVSSKQKN